ncbi:borealin [Octopus bimaculoides]|uniref:Uncharacterized protein n=1 Tax=Octopus bimaculoides TaxID=37653 RepID=A0A0L8GWS6_OCTBM|nr:borealin [Octopus bimaculoides]|eukprot:XP_014777343.1 PREDICTED: borealin-like [Octopus bimaculoides]
MPRKRQTKKVRREPVLPNGDEGKDLTKEEQQAKLQVFLDDFDRKFEEKKQEFDDKISLTLKKIDTYCHIGIQQIPKTLRKMKLQDFIAAGGTFESALQYLTMEKENTVDENVVGSLNAIACGEKASKNQLYNDPTFQKVAGDCATSLQMFDLQEAPSTVKRTKLKTVPENNFPLFEKPLIENQLLTDAIDMSIQRTLRQRRPRNTKGSMQAPSTIKTRSSKRTASNARQQTPLTNWSSSQFLMTPAITPKFDPRLPITPFDRSPRQGERFMSLEGSPVVVRSQNKIDKIRERISTALMNEALAGTESIKILNEVLEVIKE